MKNATICIDAHDHHPTRESWDAALRIATDAYWAQLAVWDRKAQPHKAILFYINFTSDEHATVQFEISDLDQVRQGIDPGPQPVSVNDSVS